MNVNLWFARDANNEIISILDTIIENEYVCPICSSKVIPKALESKKMTPHFAHVDVTKCNSESMLHWWFKHKFIEKGDKFSIKTDSEIEFTCKDFNTEVTYQLDSGIYRPDLVIQTECGREIVFEMANTNKKKVQDYIDKWIELDRIVVEVDIKTLQSIDEVKLFNALYYQGKCFNFNKRDGGYYNTIGKLKEEMKTSGKYDIELVKKLDWFWCTLVNYDSEASDISEVTKIIDELMSTSYSHCSLVNRILRKSSCSRVYTDYKTYKELDNLVTFSCNLPPKYVFDIIHEVKDKLIRLDSRLEIKLKSIVDPIYESYYHGSRKYMYKSRLVGKNYNFEMNVYNKKRKIMSIPITNGFNSRVDKKEFVINSVITAMSNFKHKCIECNCTYMIELGELKFFINKGFELPKRCKSCRQKRKQNKELLHKSH